MDLEAVLNYYRLIQARPGKAFIHLEAFPSYAVNPQRWSHYGAEEWVEPFYIGY